MGRQAKDYKTIEEFNKEFYPELSQRQLGRLMGVSDGVMSKIKSGEYRLTAGKAKQVAEWMLRNHNVVLIQDSSDYKAEKKYEKKYRDIIREKDRRIMELEGKIQELIYQIEFDQAAKKYGDFFRCSLKKEEANKKRKNKKVGGK